MDQTRRSLLAGSALFGIGVVATRPMFAQQGQSVSVVSEPPSIKKESQPSAPEIDGSFQLQWHAASRGIGHDRGSQHRNRKWWTDPCDDFSKPWTCYGPYVRLLKGSYKCKWFVYVKPAGAGPVGGTDVVANEGKHTILPEFRFKVKAGDGHYTVTREFTLLTDVDKVEFRLKSYPSAKLFIAETLVVSDA